MPDDSASTKVTDRTNDHQYFIVTPRIVWALSRNPHDYILWCVVRDIAGERGECLLSRQDLADMCMMSTGQVSDSRKYLLRVKLLIGELRRDPGYPHPVWHLRVPDLWESNIKWVAKHMKIAERIEWRREQKASPHDGTQEASPHDAIPSPHDVTLSPTDTKKNQEKNQKEYAAGAAIPDLSSLSSPRNGQHRSGVLAALAANEQTATGLTAALETLTGRKIDPRNKTTSGYINDLKEWGATPDRCRHFAHYAQVVMNAPRAGRINTEVGWRGPHWKPALKEVWELWATAMQWKPDSDSWVNDPEWIDVTGAGRR